MGPEWARMGPNGPEWAPNGPEWNPNGPELDPNGPERARMGPNGPKWARMGPNGPEWARMGPGEGCGDAEMAEQGFTMSATIVTSWLSQSSQSQFDPRGRWHKIGWMRGSPPYRL